MKNKPPKIVNTFEALEGIITPLETTSEEREIDLWVDKDVLAEFDESIEIDLREAKDIKEISFMCEKPQNCDSHQQYGECCRCIRENFDSPRSYEHWKHSITNLLESEVENLVRKNRK